MPSLWTRRSLLQATGAAGLACAVPGAARARSLGGRAFGSYWRLVAPDLSGSGPDVAAEIAAIVRSVDRAMSPYAATSELSRINRSDSRDWLPVSPETGGVLRAGLDVAGLSQGAFDPTVGPLVARYGFGPIHGTRQGDAGDLELRAGAMRKGRPGLTLDLCGIAKGHALDRIVARLAAVGLKDFLVELGGEVAVHGRASKARPWRVAIDGTDIALALETGAVATSGHAAQGYRLGDRRYGHIVDPASERPATGDLVSVSVLAASAMLADAWATALFSRGSADRAVPLAEAAGLDAVLTFRDGAARRSLTTGGAGLRRVG